MHYLIFIKCSTIDEDYQIKKNTQHSKILNHCRAANQRLYKLHVQNKRKREKEREREGGGEGEKKKTEATNFSVHHTHQDKMHGTFMILVLHVSI